MYKSICKLSILLNCLGIVCLFFFLFLGLKHFFETGSLVAQSGVPCSICYISEDVLELLTSCLRLLKLMAFAIMPDTLFFF